MKSAPFEFQRPQSIDEALVMLSDDEDVYAKLIGGGQSLGPMLNLRLVQPDRIVDISLLDGLNIAETHTDTMRIGAGVRHAQIEDGEIADVTNGFLPHVASGIAFRAVRNRGTLGGSLAHADPAADWVATMCLLDATMIVRSPSPMAERTVKADQFFAGAFTTALTDDELLLAVDIPIFSPHARWAYLKSCRKPGEFADALAAVWVDPGQDIYRLVIGALSTEPYVFVGATALQALSTPPGLSQALDDAGVSDPVERQLQSTMVRRALAAVATDPTVSSK